MERDLRSIMAAEARRSGYSDKDAERMAQEALDAHAHELAEQIRNSEWLRDYTDDHMGDCNAAADIIDPRST